MKYPFSFVVYFTSDDGKTVKFASYKLKIVAAETNAKYKHDK